MKKLILSLMLTLCLMLPVSAYADTAETATEQQNVKPTPISVERKNIDGTEYLIKTYETSTETEPNQLEEEPFELDGFLFSLETTDTEMNENADTKTVTEEAKAESQSKNLEEVIKQFPATKSYDKDGYKGTLTLDTGSIVTEVAGYTTRNYTVSTVKEYPGLMYADPSFVSQTAIKDGYTLPLADINWVVMGTGLSGDSLVPTEYKATATYAKTFSSQVPTGYISTARYTGDVTKTIADTVTYTLTYVGRDADAIPTVLKVISGIIGLLLLVGGAVVLVMYFRNKNGVDVYNLINKEYIHIGHQAVDPKTPIIDLNEFEDMIQSNVFQFILDKKTATALFGRNISVTLKDVTVKHRVNGRNKEYPFELDLGGVLDAE